MMLSDRDIRRYMQSRKLIITPLSDDTIRENGVDLKIGGQIARLKSSTEPVDIEDANRIREVYDIQTGDEFIISPREHVLLTTLERVKMPENVVGFVNLRSTFARLGLLIPPTIIDAGFEGEITIEVVGSEFPVRMKKGTRFIHVVFGRTMSTVEKPYHGKYSGQSGVTLPKI